MDYQTWLKAFAVELSHQWSGIAVEDLDSLHLQSLYHRGISPLEAARQQPVLKNLKPAPKPVKDPGPSQWLFVGAAMAAMLAAGLVWRMQRIHAVSVAKANHHVQDAQPLPVKGGYPSETVNFGTFPGESPLFAHSLPYHTGVAGFVHHSLATTDATQSAAISNVAMPADQSGGTLVNPASDLGLPTQVRNLRPTSTGAGYSTDQQVPTIQQFQVISQDQNTLGYSGQITWQVTNADMVEILVDGSPVPGSNANQGSLPFSGLQLGAIVTIRASKGGHSVDQSANVEAVQG